MHHNNSSRLIITLILQVNKPKLKGKMPKAGSQTEAIFAYKYIYNNKNVNKVGLPRTNSEKGWGQRKWTHSILNIFIISQVSKDYNS